MQFRLIKKTKETHASVALFHLPPSPQQIRFSMVTTDQFASKLGASPKDVEKLLENENNVLEVTPFHYLVKILVFFILAALI